MRLETDWRPIRAELLAMAEEDLRVRGELAADGSLFQGYHPRMRAVHDAHAGRLARILDDRGWPGVTQVGRDGAEAAWLIVQHAIAQPAIQRRALELMAAAADRGEASALHAATLDDRIRCSEGRPQRYGTQFDWDDSGQLSPLPVEEPAGLDARRRSVGLGPMAEAIERHRRAARESGDPPPADWAARRREMEAWFREVGWRR